MTSALQVSPVAELRASNSQETLRDARIPSSAVADTMHGGIKGETIPVQVDHLAKLMYCLPISDSKSLPATAIQGATRTTASATTPAIADSDQTADIYCLPISESKSLPATAIKGLTKTTSSDITSTIADSGQTADNSKASSSISSPQEDHDRGNPKLPKRDAHASEETKAESVPHHPRCECGCIPPTPSLFEMAELRRQYRERLKNGGKSEAT